MANINIIQEIVLVSLGSILGANARFIIYKKFKVININGYYSILIINIFSSFLLGLSIPILSTIKTLTLSSHLVFFLIIGFLGSLSTFSTFIYDLFYLSQKCKFLKAFEILIFSFSLGIIAVAMGSLIG